MLPRPLRPPTLALLAVLTGAFLRFHQLGNIPPGLHYDFAANAILANDIAFGGFREVFITAYTGKETLFFYSAALLFKTVGSSIFALQLTAAFYGVLGIAACYFAARELTRSWPHSGWAAALAAAILSFTFMHLVWSRYGERAVTEPFVQGLAVGFLFRGFNSCHGERKARREGLNIISAFSANPAVNFSLAGAFTGLAAYTYLAARLFPIPIAVALLIHLWTTAKQKPSHHPVILSPSHPVTAPPLLRALALYGLFLLAALLVFAPLGLFFLQHPEAFLVRVSQLTPREGETDLLLRGLTGALGLIFVSGEPYDRFNIPLRPIFGPLLGIFFIIGLALILYRLVVSRFARRAIPHSSLPGLFLLAYTLTFLVPTAVSVHDIFPSNVRSMGLMPLLPIFPALGITAVLRAIVSRLPSGVNRQWSFVAHHSSTVIVLLAGALTTYHSYFNVWATAPSLHYANDTDLVNAARWLNTQNTANTSVYLSAVHYRHPTVAYLARDFGSFRWFTGGQALAIPPGPALYVFPHAAPPPHDWIEAWVPVAAPPGPDGTPDFRAYRFDSPPPLPDFVPFNANFGNLVEVTGYRTPSPGTLDVRLRVLNPPDRPDYRLVADLYDVGGFQWAQTFNDAYFSEQWQVGETLLMRLTYELPIGIPPGDYVSRLTVFSASAQTTLPALTPEGYAAAFAAVGPTPITGAGPQPLAQPILTLSGVNLIALDPPPARRRPGEPLPFALHWQLQSPLTNHHLLITKLNDLTLESAAPAHNTYPFTEWQTGEIVIDRHNPRLPRDLAPGVYNVTVNDFLIGTVTVESISRQFSPPSPSHVLITGYQSLLELVGYDLGPDSLTLYWHALAETDTNYTRFVHVLDGNDSIIAQSDTYPVNGSYPTSLWLRGEYVTETIGLPTNGAAIEIGWYVAETGERLKTETGDAARITP